MDIEIRYTKFPNMPMAVKMYVDELFSNEEEFEVWLGNNAMFLDSFHEFYDWDAIGNILMTLNEIREEQDE